MLRRTGRISHTRGAVAPPVVRRPHVRSPPLGIMANLVSLPRLSCLAARFYAREAEIEAPDENTTGRGRGRPDFDINKMPDYFFKIPKDPVELIDKSQAEYIRSERASTQEPRPLVGGIAMENVLRRQRSEAKRMMALCEPLTHEVSTGFARMFWQMPTSSPNYVWTMYEAYKNMELIPPAVMYRKLIDIFVQAGEIKRVVSLLEDMRRAKAPVSVEIIATLRTHTRGYGDVMKILLAARHYDTVGKVAGIMKSKGETQEGTEKTLARLQELEEYQRIIREEKKTIEEMYQKLVDEKAGAAKEKLDAWNQFQEQVHGLRELTWEKNEADRFKKKKAQQLSGEDAAPTEAVEAGGGGEHAEAAAAEEVDAAGEETAEAK